MNDRHGYDTTMKCHRCEDDEMSRVHTRDYEIMRHIEIAVEALSWLVMAFPGRLIGVECASCHDALAEESARIVQVWD
jgi:hypothetical protein